MEIATFNKRPDLEKSNKLGTRFINFEKLIHELKKKEIPPEIIHSINQLIGEINAYSGPNKAMLKKLRRVQSSILEVVEKECKLVTKNHYRNRWLAVGMVVFGIPFGAAFGVSLGNMAFVGIGIPIGMAIGIGIGTALDNKAFENGKQLGVDIN